MLDLDQMQNLDVNVNDTTNAIADALAVLHWHTKVDGTDVEYVLESSPTYDLFIAVVSQFSYRQRRLQSVPTST